MPSCLNLYMDDSGTRQPDRHPTDTAHRFDYFAMGGILIAEADEAQARQLYNEFCTRWGIDYPLHSVDIRHSAGAFSWLNEKSRAERIAFYAAIHKLICSCSLQVIACVIDRTGYNARYRDTYGANRWHLCKTAFTIALERSARLALDRGMKLRVHPEKCNKKADQAIERYYREARANGMPFDPSRSAKYSPLTSEILSDVLYDLRFKAKSSPMVQLADLVLYPVARYGYEPEYLPYQLLKQDGKLIDCILNEDDIAGRGIKYSCFDNYHGIVSGEADDDIVSSLQA